MGEYRYSDYYYNNNPEYYHSREQQLIKPVHYFLPLGFPPLGPLDFCGEWFFCS